MAEEWVVESEGSVARSVSAGSVFRLVQGKTVLHCQVKASPAVDIVTRPYSDTVSGSFVWEGDRESPV